MKKSKAYRNLPAIIAEELREQILDGTVSPGERLKQQEIASQFEASLIPVREAFRILEMEGLITIYPNKGAVVTSLSAQEVSNIFETRIILEAGALEKSIPNLTEEDFLDADYLIRKLDRTDDGKNLSRLNKELHELLYHGSQNDYLLAMIDSHYKNTERYMRFYLQNPEDHKQSQDYHRKILAACKEKDISNAVALLKKHMMLAMDDLMTRFSD